MPRAHYHQGSDVKKLRKAALDVLGPSVTEDDLSTILPPKADVQMVKMSNKALVFTVKDQPLFFDPHGRGQVFPTVYTLWAFPNAIKSLLTFSEVSPKVLGGADLMLPGVIAPPEGLPEFDAGEIMVLRIPDNPHPFAVGEMETDSASATASGMKGRGLKVLHHFPDPVWAMGDKSMPCDAFRPERIFPLGTEIQAPASVAPKEKAAPPTAEVAAMGIGDGGGIDSGKTGGMPPIDVSTPAGMDAMFERCFMAGMRDKLADSDLPMRCELFYANCVLPSRPEDVTLDLKKSSFKKQAKLFSVMEKKGLIKCKAIHKQDNIISVNREHKLFLEYCAAVDLAEIATRVDAPGGAAAADGGASTSGGVSGGAKFEITNVYRASTMYRPIFGEKAVGNKDRLYTQQECSEALMEYCTLQKLLKEEGSTAGPDSVVVLDTLLGKELFNKKEAEGPGTEMLLRLVLPRLIKKLQLHTKVCVERPGEERKETILKRNLHPIRVLAEDRHAGRKFITKVSGLEDFCIDPKDFSSTLQRAFSTSCALEKLPGKQETGMEISIQGNVLKELVGILRNDWGIPDKFIEVEDKTK